MGLSLRAPGGKFDVEEARRALAVLCDPLLAHELRGLPTGASVILPGNQVEALAKKAEELSRTNNSVYLCLNPVPLDCRPEKAVKDVHVERRRWLMVDVDPVKPDAHKDDPASDEEKAKVAALAGEVKDYLTELGWPAPVGIDSGNGAYLLYRVDLPADETTRALCKDFLWRLDKCFSGPNGKIDRATHNAARIAKVPGALSKKIGATESKERPFRISRLVGVPNVLACVTAEQIGSALQEATETVAEDASFAFGANAEPAVPEINGAGKLKLIAKREPTVWDRAIEYLRACPPAITRQEGHSQTMSVARAIVWGFDLGQDAGFSLLWTEYNPRCLPPWNESELRHKCKDAEETPDPDSRPRGYLLLEDDRRQARFSSKPRGKRGAAKQEPAIELPPPEVFTLDELLAREIAPPKWVVPGLLSEGLVIMAGPVKAGKSWFSLNLALTVAAGGKVLGHIQAIPGDVLYLSLEDRLRRVQYRARRLMASSACSGAGQRLSIAVTWPNQSDGGLDEIARWIDRVGNPTLVIIDVWQKFRPPAGGKGQGNAYQEDYKHLTELKTVFDEKNVSCLIIHHLKKSRPEDIVEAMSGSNAMGGAVDGILVLARPRNENEGTLFVTGRDVDEQKLAVKFDPDTLVWTSMGDAESRVQSVLGKKIMDIMKGAGAGVPFWPSNLLELAGCEDKTTGGRTLRRLAERGIIQRKGRMFCWPDDVTPGVQEDEDEVG